MEPAKNDYNNDSAIFQVDGDQLILPQGYPYAIQPNVTEETPEDARSKRAVFNDPIHLSFAAFLPISKILYGDVVE